MTQDELIILAKDVADTHQLFSHVICGICEQESTWNPSESRFEHGWYDRTDWDSLLKQSPYPSLCTAATERALRSMSHGLMQVLGQSARDTIYFKGWLGDLYIPEVGLELGCQLFSIKLRHAQGSYEQALQLWNGGANPSYASEVIAKSEKYKSKGEHQ